MKKYRKRKVVILDIPLLLENNINTKKDILIFVQSKKSEITKRLKKRSNFNQKLFEKLKKIQLPVDYKRKKSKFIILEVNNEKEGVPQLDFFRSKGKQIEEIKNASLDDSTGNFKRKTYIIN